MKSRTDLQRPRNWIAETVVVAGIVAFGYFAVTLEAAHRQGHTQPEPAFSSPLDLLR